MNISKLENTLNNWYSWLFETNDNELIKWYTKYLTMLLKMLKNNKKIKRLNELPKFKEH